MVVVIMTVVPSVVGVFPMSCRVLACGYSEVSGRLHCLSPEYKHGVCGSIGFGEGEVP